eukprot:TRINITY_DN13474_c0_g1_i1.p3 TRINITY_DN13474_c0_g1~~TRINITY_DN13474_c0_g1_i1.p3  ORF type:complete len:119 (-),score=18.02 TRINITY_DN13474_c0_g1_i1:209-565(-)
MTLTVGESGSPYAVRPRRMAADRREQRLRAHSRALQFEAKTMAILPTHRGSQTSFGGVRMAHLFRGGDAANSCDVGGFVATPPYATAPTDCRGACSEQSVTSNTGSNDGGSGCHSARS